MDDVEDESEEMDPWPARSGIEFEDAKAVE